MTPLMLSIMSLAFQRAGADELAGQKGDSTDERRKRVFHRYVEEMFQHKETVSAVFQKEKTINWLSWLARKTREHSRSVFLVEGLQPSWLGKTSEWVAYITVVCLSLVPIVGLMSWLIYEFDQIRWVFVTLLWLTFVQINPPRDITLVEAIRWNWSKFRGWAIFFPIACLLDLIIGRFRGLLSGHFRDEWSWFLFSIMAVGSLLNGLTYTVHEEKVFPNQGIKLSRNISLAVSLVCLLVLTLGALFSKLFYQKMLAVLMSGLGVAFFTGLSFGGSAVIKHYALRLALWLDGSAPLNIVTFLDHCARLILLKKVGGGYIFIHRMLLEYFAELTPESIRAGDKTTGSKQAPL